MVVVVKDCYSSNIFTPQQFREKTLNLQLYTYAISFRPKTTTTKSITTEDVEAVAATVPQKTKPKSFEKNNSITRISTPPFKDKVEPLPNFGTAILKCVKIRIK